MRYFDYENAAREANIPPDKLAQLCEMVREEFPQDDNMYELHVLRACMAIKEGVVTIADAIQAEPHTTRP